MESTEDNNISTSSIDDISALAKEPESQAHDYTVRVNPVLSRRTSRSIKELLDPTELRERSRKLIFKSRPVLPDSTADLWELRELLAINGLSSQICKNTLIVFLPLTGVQTNQTEDIDTSTAGKIAIPLRNCPELRIALQALAEDRLRLHCRVLTASESDLIESHMKVQERTILLQYGREIYTKRDIAENVPIQVLELLACLIAADIPCRIIHGRLFVMPDAGTAAEVVGMPLYNLAGIVYEIADTALTRFLTVIDRATQQLDSELCTPLEGNCSDAAWRQLCQTILSTVALLGEPLFQNASTFVLNIAAQIVSGTGSMPPEREALRNILISITGQLMTTDKENNLILYARVKTNKQKRTGVVANPNGIWKLTPGTLKQMEAAVKTMYIDLVGARDRNAMSFSDRSNANQRMKISRVHLTSLIDQLGEPVPDTDIPSSLQQKLTTRAELRSLILPEGNTK